eukprot:scaffold42576_cov27-Tisochrysis_lutea.AAC.1
MLREAGKQRVDSRPAHRHEPRREGEHGNRVEWNKAGFGAAGQSWSRGTKWVRQKAGNPRGSWWEPPSARLLSLTPTLRAISVSTFLRRSCRG